MAKTKAELIEEAKKLGVEVDDKAKVAEIKAVIDKAESANSSATDTADTVSPAATTETDEAQVAKAGKRSAKALREESERQAKEERKASDETEVSKPKKIAPPTRSRLERRAKGYRKSVEQIEKTKKYSLKEAAELAKKTSHVKFDATIELHVNLSVDPKLADQNVRDTVILPSGTGKTVKIAVFTDDASAATKAGADIAGTDEIIAMLDKGVTDFDILISAPKMMAQLGKYARTLGPRGLMPNPKSGTVAVDVAKAVGEAKAGRVEYRVDSTGIIHLGVGKVSFSEQQLLDNLQVVLDSIKTNKPGSVKGVYIQKAYLTTSMGPSIQIDSASLS